MLHLITYSQNEGLIWNSKLDSLRQLLGLTLELAVFIPSKAITDNATAEYKPVEEPIGAYIPFGISFMSRASSDNAYYTYYFRNHCDVLFKYCNETTS